MEDLEVNLKYLQAQFEERQNAASPSSQGEAYPGASSEREGTSQIINKFSLGLSTPQSQKNQKTVETTIPAGAFAQTVLLSGLMPPLR